MRKKKSIISFNLSAEYIAISFDNKLLQNHLKLCIYSMMKNKPQEFHILYHSLKTHKLYPVSNFMFMELVTFQHQKHSFIYFYLIEKLEPIFLSILFNHIWREFNAMNYNRPPKLVLQVDNCVKE